MKQHYVHDAHGSWRIKWAINNQKSHVSNYLGFKFFGHLVTPPSITESNSYCSFRLRLTYDKFVQLIDNLIKEIQKKNFISADIFLYRWEISVLFTWECPSSPAKNSLVKYLSWLVRSYHCFVFRWRDGAILEQIVRCERQDFLTKFRVRKWERTSSTPDWTLNILRWAVTTPRCRVLWLE